MTELHAMSAIKPIPLRVYRIEYQPSPVILDYQGMKIGFPDLVLRELNRQSEYIACLQAERDNRDKTLNDIAKALGLETDDVDGIGAAIEGLKRDAARYRFLRNQVGYTKHGPSLPCGHVSADRRIEMAAETDTNIDKALAAGEAGNGN